MNSLRGGLCNRDIESDMSWVEEIELSRWRGLEWGRLQIVVREDEIGEEEEDTRNYFNLLF